jgi:SAM-dependent methyltransferase
MKQKKSTEETYDELAAAYAGSIDHASPYNSCYERPAMLAEIPSDLKDKHILDAGCSTGWYCEQLLKRGGKVTGIDLSGKMVEAARRRVATAEFLQHDLSQKLLFADGTFDLIISSLTLHYLKDWDSIFAEFARVLKPKGQLIFSIHHPFMDFYDYPEITNYFSTSQITETWTKPEVTIDVTFYRRPLEDVINVVTKHLTLTKMVEMKPADSMLKVRPEAYQHLMTNPHFMIIKAVK